ncbi:MAG: tRNA (adenosine(37)-N6)-dimethylallyltransferase MiaA [Lentisphaerae bacterium]|nr:tRNA (adenosine(37)-N6)-dimethylallyltransferase MiaA [Lentisphaerota bacterium]
MKRMRFHLPPCEREAFFLVGPTASGKSAVAQYLAERCAAAILSADAMQVYRGLDIGTAKPSAAERARVRYYGLNLIDFHEPFSVAAYRRSALQAVHEVAARKQPLIVVGGTGLYIKSLTDGLATGAPPQLSIRLAGERLLAAEGVGALQDWLRRVAPESFAALADQNNPRRLIRALEKALAGQPPAPRNWSASEKCPLWSTAELYARIQSRVEAMFTGGLLAEVEQVLHSGLELSPTARAAIGYAEAMACLRGECSLEDAKARTVLRTRQLAKRQTTWFRHQCHVAWLAVDATMTLGQIAEMVWAYWQKHGPTPMAGGDR